MLSCRLEHVRCLLSALSVSSGVSGNTLMFPEQREGRWNAQRTNELILVLLWNKFKIFKMFPPQELILCAGFRSAAESSHPVSMLASVNHQWTVGVMWCHQLCRCLHLASSWRERERGFSLHDEHRDSHWSWSVYWTHVRNFYTKRLFLWSRVFTWVTSCWEDQETQTWFIITSVSLNIGTVWHVHHQ